MNVTFKYSLEGQESERLLFRKLEPSDFDAWLSFCEDEASLRYMPFLSQLKDPRERCNAWFEKVFSRYENSLGGMNALVDKMTNKFVGQCGLLVHTIDGITELEIGYSLMPLEHKKGYAIEAAKKCKAFAFENNFAHSLISIIDIQNQASANVALRNGMILDKQTNYNSMLVNIFRVNKTTKSL